MINPCWVGYSQDPGRDLQPFSAISELTTDSALKMTPQRCAIWRVLIVGTPKNGWFITNNFYWMIWGYILRNHQIIPWEKTLTNHAHSSGFICSTSSAIKRHRISDALHVQFHACWTASIIYGNNLSGESLKVSLQNKHIKSTRHY